MLLSHSTTLLQTEISMIILWFAVKFCKAFYAEQRMNAVCPDTQISVTDFELNYSLPWKLGQLQTKDVHNVQCNDNSVWYQANKVDIFIKFNVN